MGGAIYVRRGAYNPEEQAYIKNTVFIDDGLM